MQAWYRLTVTAADGPKQSWDSGMVNSTDTVAVIQPSALNLTSDTLFDVALAWGPAGDEAGAAPVTGQFEMGPVGGEDAWYGAAWLGANDHSMAFHWGFSLPAGDPVDRAALTVDAPGCAVVVANGIAVNGITVPSLGRRSAPMPV